MLRPQSGRNNESKRGVEIAGCVMSENQVTRSPGHQVRRNAQILAY